MQTNEKLKTEELIENPKPKWRWPWTELGVLFFYLVLTAVLTWPLVLSFNHAVPFGPPEDRFQNFWNFWWVERALRHFHNPYQTDVLFYPYYNGGSNPTVPLYLHTLQLLNTLVALPFTVLSGVASAYNVIIFFAFSFSGLGAFLLARHITKNFWAGLLAGLVYTFSTSHFGSMQSSITNIMSIQWLPFYAWALQLWHERRNWKWAALAAVFLALVAYTDWYNTLYLLFYTGFFYVITSWPRQWLKQLPGVAIALAGGVLLGAVAIIPAFFTLRSPIFAAQLDQNRDIRSSKTLVDVVNPGQSPAAIFFWIGLVAGIALIIWGGKWRRAGGYWLAFYLLCSLFTLGPRLQIAQVGSEPTPTDIPLPYALLKLVPGASVMRSPDRFDIPAQLALALLFALALERLTTYFAKKSPQSSVLSPQSFKRFSSLILHPSSLILLILALPYLLVVNPAPLKLVEVAPASFVSALPKEGNYSLLELPITRHYNFDHERMLNQIYHEQPIMGGYLARPVSDPYRTPESPFRYLSDQSYVYGDDPNKEIFSAHHTFALVDNLIRLYNFRYIVVYKEDYKFERERQGIRNLIEKQIGAGAVLQEDDHTILYKVPDSFWRRPAVTPALFVGDGWYSVEQNQAGLYRWTGQGADLFVTVSQPTHLKMSFDILAFGGDRNLRVSADNQKLYEGRITPAPQPLQFEFDAPAGTTRLHLESATPAQSSKELGQGQDNRLLAFLVRNIKLQ